jgi:hypothetical protein
VLSVEGVFSVVMVCCVLGRLTGCVMCSVLKVLSVCVCVCVFSVDGIYCVGKVCCVLKRLTGSSGGTGWTFETMRF